VVSQIKHDGFRVVARKAGERVRLYSHPGNDLTYRPAHCLAVDDAPWRAEPHQRIDDQRETRSTKRALIVSSKARS